MKKKYSVLNTYKYMYGLLWNYSPKFAIQIIFEIITGAVQPLIGVLLPSIVVGMLEGNCTVGQLALTCLFVFGLVGAIFGVNSFLINSNGGLYITHRISKFWPFLIRKTIEMPFALYEQSDTQLLYKKASKAISSNREGLEGFYRHNTDLCISFIGLVLYCLIISRVNILIVILLLGLSVIQYIFYIYARNYQNKHKDKQSEYSRHKYYLSTLATDIKGGKDIRLYQLQDWITGKYQEYHNLYRRQHQKEQMRFFLYDFIGLALQVLRDGVSYGYLIYLLTQGMSVSEFILYTGIISGFGEWFTKISEKIALISSAMIQIEDYRDFETLSNLNNSIKKGIIDIDANQTFDVQFEDVSFVYPNSDIKILDHISFHIKPGEKIALVGVNGAGKTTLVKMLCGFYKPTSGRILINGVDITELNPEKYFEQLSVLFQDSILLSFTIAQNITGQIDEDIDKERLMMALQKSGLYEKVQTLPKKEMTFIGKDVENDGIQLSGGQIQKLYLARAIYKRSLMLILDEPTAALDAIAESEMYGKYVELMDGKTSIFISHRLSSTRFCDKIYYLENGRIKETGTHDSLMQLDGSYAHMFNVQSQYYNDGGEAHEVKRHD